jgi:hypothetical protein
LTITTFTDYLGNPIKPGDIIVYPTAVGSSSADMNMARVEVVDPLVLSPTGHGYCYQSMVNKQHATRQLPKKEVRAEDGTRVWVDSPEKAYGLKIKKLKHGRLTYEESDRLFNLRNVDRVVVVTSLVAGG